MNKKIIIGLGILFAAAILTTGCGKQEEKKSEAPSVTKQTIEEKAPALKQEMIEKTEQAVEATTEKITPMTEQAVETAKEMGQQAMDSAVKKMPAEGQQAVEIAKQYSGGQMEQAATEEAKATSGTKVPHELETKPAPGDAGASVEQMMKEKAAEQGMKLPGKY